MKYILGIEIINDKNRIEESCIARYLENDNRLYLGEKVIGKIIGFDYTRIIVKIEGEEKYLSCRDKIVKVIHEDKCVKNLLLIEREY